MDSSPNIECPQIFFVGIKKICTLVGQAEEVSEASQMQ